MDRKYLTLLLAALLLAGCTLPFAATPAPTPTQIVIPTSTPQAPSPTTRPPTLTFTPIPTATATTASVPATQPPGGLPPVINPGSTSGPYAVILVLSNDALNVRSAPGANNKIIGTLAYNATGITRTGPWSQVAGSVWVEIQSADGVRGWVNSNYLTEYIVPSSTCDPKVTTLMTQLEQAILTSNGKTLELLVSPAHGMDVWAYRSGRPINFDSEHARWVFDSTYSHNWGSHPASGQNITGPFHEAILPSLVEVFNVSHTTTCNDTEISSYTNTWPEEYANINVVKSYKPGSPGVELDWRTLLVGVEYVGGKPYIFSIIQFIWTP